MSDVYKTKCAIIDNILDSEELSKYSKEDAIRIVIRTKVDEDSITTVPRSNFIKTTNNAE